MRACSQERSIRVRGSWWNNERAGQATTRAPKKKKGLAPLFRMQPAGLRRLQHVTHVDRLDRLHHEAVGHLFEDTEDNHDAVSLIRQVQRAAFEDGARLRR